MMAATITALTARAVSDGELEEKTYGAR